MPRPHRSLALLLTAALLLLGGCGGAARSQRVDAGAGATAGQGTSVPLPTLPPVAERHPEAYDASGCAQVGPDEVDCSATAADVDRAAAHPADGWRTLAGYVGPHYATEVVAGTVVLLDGTTTTATDGPWRATGLVRNDTTAPVTDVVVEATLLDASGSELGRARGDVPVDPIRPGEPAPFDVRADVPATAVAEVRWTVDFRPSDAADERLVELVTWWDRPADDPDAVDLYLYRDAPDGPRPYLLFGAITNHGAVELPSPTVVAAWTDGDGRVVAVAETAAVTDPVAATGGPPLAPGASADFLFVLDERPAAVDDGQVLLWAVGR